MRYRKMMTVVVGSIVPLASLAASSGPELSPRVVGSQHAVFLTGNL